MEIPKLRLQRAREHIQQFAFEAGEFLKTNPYRIVKERYTENAQEYLSLRFRVSQQPPKRLGIIAGDIINNLRAILDNTICALGEAHNVPSAKSLYFPITHKDRAGYDKLIKGNNNLRGFKRLPASAIDLIENLQPYHTRPDPTSNWLYVLNRLWNEDKHRAPALMAGTNRSFSINRATLSGPGGFISPSVGAIEDGAEVLRTAIIPDNPDPEIDVTYTIDIAFDKLGPAKGAVALQTFWAMHSNVEGVIISQFEPLFP